MLDKCCDYSESKIFFAWMCIFIILACISIVCSFQNWSRDVFISYSNTWEAVFHLLSYCSPYYYITFIVANIKYSLFLWYIYLWSGSLRQLSPTKRYVTLMEYSVMREESSKWRNQVIIFHHRTSFWNISVVHRVLAAVVCSQVWYT